MLRVPASFHEAGHIIIARALGCAADWAVIDDTSGQCAHGAPLCERDEAIILFAGTITQHLVAPGSPRGRSDFERLAAIADADQHRPAAEALVRLHWDLIERVALRLLEQGSLTAAEIQEACAPRAAWVS
jgi:hypothetical protein